MFDVIRIPAFKDNYIWLLRKGASAVVVDPGDARPVLEVLEREGLALTSILIFHWLAVPLIFIFYIVLSLIFKNRIA